MSTSIRAASGVENVAISRAIGESVSKEAGRALARGEHTVDLTLRIFGTIKKGEPYTSASAMSVPWQALFVLAAEELTEAAFKRFAARAAAMVEQKAAERDETTTKQMAPHKPRKDVAKLCEDLVAAMAKENDGRITAKLNVAVIEAGAAAGT